MNAQELKKYFPHVTEAIIRRSVTPDYPETTKGSEIARRVREEVQQLPRAARERWARAAAAVAADQRLSGAVRLNKLEQAWLNEMKERRYAEIRIQSITLKLGPDCRYTADFSALAEDGLCLFEVKGPFRREDAMVKLRVAAAMYCYLTFYLVERINGQWKLTWVTP